MVSMKNKFLPFIYICLLAFMVVSCASKSQTAENQAEAPASQPRQLTLIDDETVEVVELVEEEAVEPVEEETPSAPAHTFVTVIENEEGTSYLINLADIIQRITFSKLSADDYDLNYQAVVPLSLSFWGRELPKTGDTVVVSFTGTSGKSIPAPVYAGLLGNGFGTQMEFWDNLVSFDDDEENYVLFTKDIKAGQSFTATATFRLYEDCQNNIALHLVYPLKENTEACVWEAGR